MQMFYIDSDGDARHTGVGAAMKTNAATRRAFNSLRPLAAPFDQAAFLCDTITTAKVIWWTRLLLAARTSRASLASR